MDPFQVLACRLTWQTLYNGYGVIHEWAIPDVTMNYYCEDNKKWWPVRGKHLWTHFK